jgi:hypothetical protein
MSSKTIEGEISAYIIIVAILVVPPGIAAWLINGMEDIEQRGWIMFLIIFLLWTFNLCFYFYWERPKKTASDKGQNQETEE